MTAADSEHSFEDIKSFLEGFANYYSKELETEFKVSLFQTNFPDEILWYWI